MKKTFTAAFFALLFTLAAIIPAYIYIWLIYGV